MGNNHQTEARNGEIVIELGKTHFMPGESIEGFIHLDLKELV